MLNHGHHLQSRNLNDICTFWCPLVLFLTLLSSLFATPANSHLKKTTTETWFLDEMSGKMNDQILLPTQNDFDVTIDKGDVNEKERLYNSATHQGGTVKSKCQQHAGPADEQQFDPQNKLSHELHTIVGLDRYPNYLSRWSRPGYENDIDSLERKLKQRLNQIQQQKADLIARKVAATNIFKGLVIEETNGSREWSNFLNRPTNWDDVRKNILHPQASKIIFESSFFKANRDVTVDNVLEGKVNVHLNEALLEDWIDQEMFDVYSFPLLSEEFCKSLRFIMNKFLGVAKNEEYSQLKLGRGVIDLDVIGMGWVTDLIFELVIKPISRHLFRESETQGELDFRHGYITGYTAGSKTKQSGLRNRLVPHTDDSEITLNIGLGDKFNGGNVRFWGLRGTSREGKFVDEFGPIPGTALLHSGRHLHEVSPVLDGDRYAFIVWSRSWSGVRSSTCPCCWLNRRKDERCICDPKWN